ncbi:hypothetical protein WOLCODRAFT_164381 [Wolfiporia cocos MD-104 SS10]|uniref:Uncharacterized protein n=1 Tax=Wolfiporia cocos (strain MD-104) TaxID=742152 RepID=A0A2H3K4K5_WOLCO|nr:hypothetical protein WOLCODRAFT_164381 [Wolfiporia cocos MD-104 SS10]
MSYPQMVKHLKGHYNTAEYGLSLESLKKKCRKWGIQRARGQALTTQDIGPAIERIRQRFPNQGMQDMWNTLRVEEDIHISEKKILAYMRRYHPEELEARLRERGGMVRSQFWAAGVNDIWTLDQHDK